MERETPPEPPTSLAAALLVAQGGRRTALGEVMWAVAVRDGLLWTVGGRDGSVVRLFESRSRAEAAARTRGAGHPVRVRVAREGA